MGSANQRLPNPDQPNKPEVSGTTLPLLATVLAGFAVTIISQLFTHDGANIAGPSPNKGFIAGLTILALAVPLFLHASAFAIWSQSYNYIHLSKDSREILYIQENWDTYIRKLEKKWQIWYQAAYWAFNSGMLLFDIGTGILLWVFIGYPIAFLFWMVSIIPLIITFWLRRQDKAIK